MRWQSKKFKFKAREFRGMRRTYVRRSEHEMKRNAEIGLFTKSSKLISGSSAMHSLDSGNKDQNKILVESDNGDERKMLADLGYSEKAINYYLEKPYMGSLPDADQMSEMLGTCGDTLKIFLKIDHNTIKDIRYQVLGCPVRFPRPWLLLTSLR